MLTKVATFPAIDEHGFCRVLPFGRGGQGLEKYAGLPDSVQRYIDRYFKKEDGKHGVLVTAMGAGEYWGPNSNGDIFVEKSLLHLPSGWSDDPDSDSVLAKGWPWGIPTFYNAFSFAHHQNKAPEKSIGDIKFVTWDPLMHWVLVVVLLDEKRAAKHNGSWVLDRLSSGKSIPWSMGARVPFDLSSLTPDYDRYEKAWASYDPKKHKSPADAILNEHDNVKKISGLSRTRREYPDELLYHMGEVQSDGRKIYAINDFPTFFDLSAVGVPADQVAWSIMKLGSTRCELRGMRCSGTCHGQGGACRKFATPGVVLWERLEDHMSKTASLHMASLGKGAVINKASDIDKEVVPNVGSSKALDEKETEIPREVLDHMGSALSLAKAISTPSMMGMLLRPREFRRIILVRMGKKNLADRFDDNDNDLPFSFSSEEPEGIGPDSFDDTLGHILEPLVAHRSCLGPVVHRTKIIVIKMTPKQDAKISDEETELQKKISSLYNGYRNVMIDKISGAKKVASEHPWFRDSLYGLQNLPQKVGSMSGSLVPLVTQRTIEYLRAV